jgi:hypothetical protein
MRKALTALAATAALLVACQSKPHLSQQEIQADYARQARLEADWARANADDMNHAPEHSELDLEAQRRGAQRRRQAEADRLECKMRAQDMLAQQSALTRSSIPIEAFAWSNQTYDLCMQRAALLH